MLRKDADCWIRRLCEGRAYATRDELSDGDVASRMYVVAIAFDDLIGQRLKLVDIQTRFQPRVLERPHETLKMFVEPIHLAAKRALKIVHNIACAESPVGGVDDALALRHELSVEICNQL
jgi:hypothetical protein